MTEVLLVLLTISLGIIALGVANGWFNTSVTDTTADVSENILEIKTSNMLKIEFINYTIDTHVVSVRNIAKIPLTVTRIEIIRSNGDIANSIPADNGFTELASLESGNSTYLTIPFCTTCEFNEELTVRIWYIASLLFEKSNPVISVDEMKTVETIIKNPIGEVTERCPLPDSKWILLDVIDPVTFTDTGAILPPPWNIVRLRAPLTNQPAVAELQVTVGGRGSGTGTRSYEIPSTELIGIQGEYSGIRPPFEITVQSPNYVVLQNRWYLDMLEDKIHVSGITLSWSGVDRLITSIAVQLGAAQPGKYRVTVELYDCENNLLISLGKPVRIPPNIEATTTVLSVGEAVPLYKVREIRTALEEIP